MTRSILLFLWSVCLFTGPAHKVCAQAVLSLRPHFGAQIPLCYLIDRAGSPSVFRYNNFDLHAHYGLMLHLRINDQWSMATGYSRGGAGWSYGFKSLPTTHQRRTIGADVNRFLLASYRDLKVVRWGRFYRRAEQVSELTYDSDDIFYLLLFRLQAFAAVSYDYLVPASDDNATTFVQSGAVHHYMNETIATRHGASLWLGVALQFRHQNKDRLQLHFYYSQGLRKLVDVDIDYEWQGQAYRPRLGTRGSGFGLNAAYPIRLVRFKRHGYG